VIRSTQKGESHGGVYLVDLQAETYNQLVDWNSIAIDWEGRGGDRGLRGIAFYKDYIFIAASDEVFVFDQQFQRIDSFQNRYLKHCHEITIDGDKLYCTSTGFDAILVFDLLKNKFTAGYHITKGAPGFFYNLFHSNKEFTLHTFDPNELNGPTLTKKWHINTVFVKEGKIHLSATSIANLLYIENDKILPHISIPKGTHNVTIFEEGILFNDTMSDQVILLDKKGDLKTKWEIKSYAEEDLLMSDIPEDFARQRFGRGLSTFKDKYIIGGSSPATISVYDLSTGGQAIKTINLSMDIRNAIHGLAVWPFDSNQ